MKIINQLVVQSDMPNNNNVIWVYGNTAKYYNNGTWTTLAESNGNNKEFQESINKLNNTISEHTNQIESNQSQITANKSAQDAKNTSLDANIAKLNARDDQITELIKGITPTLKVGSTSTGNAGTNANVTMTDSNNVYTLNFVIPKGDKGDIGATGAKGQDGAKGADGITPTLKVGTVTTLAAGSNATVTMSKNNNEYTLNFGIPKGNKGDTGASEGSGETTVINPTITIGTVTNGDTASATITGDSPNYTLNLVLPKGAKGDKGDAGAKGADGANGEKGEAFKYTDFTEDQLAALKGPKGEKGDQGERGEKGDMGSIGKVSISVDNTTGTPSATASSSKASDGSTDISFSFKGIKGEKGEKGERGEQGLPGNDGAKGEKGEVGMQGNSGVVDASNKTLVNDAITGGETDFLSAEIGKLGILTYDCSKGGSITHATLQDAINSVPTTFQKVGLTIIYKLGDTIHRYTLKANAWSTDPANWFSVEDKFNDLVDKTTMDTKLDKKFDKESVAQESGSAEDKVMSQKAVSDELNGLTIEKQLLNANRKVIYLKKEEFSDIDSDNIKFIIDSNIFDYITTPEIDTVVNIYNDNGIFGQYQFINDSGASQAKNVSSWINKNPSLKLNYFGEPLKHVYDALFSHLQSNFGFTVMPFGYVNKDIVLNKFFASKSYINLIVILNLDEIRAFDSKYKYLIFPRFIGENRSIIFGNINGNEYVQQRFGNSLDSLNTYVALTKKSNFAYMKLDDDAYKNYKYVAFKLTDSPSKNYDLRNNIERYMYSKVGFFLNFGIALLNIYSRESYKNSYTPVQDAYDDIIKKYFTDNSSNNIIDLNNITSGHFKKTSDNKLIIEGGGAIIYGDGYVKVKQCKYYTNILDDTTHFPIYALKSDKTVISTVSISANGIIDLETIPEVAYLAVQSSKYKWVYIVPEEYANSGIKLYNKPSTYKGIQIFHLGDSISEGSDGGTVYMPYLLSIANNILNKSIVNNIKLSSFLRYGLKISDAECWNAVKNAINESTRDKFSLITIQLGTNNGFTVPEDFESNLPTNSCADIPYDGATSIEEHLAKFPKGTAYEYCKLIEYILYYNRYCKIVFISIPEFGQTKRISNGHINTNKAIKTICDMYCVEFIDIAHISNMSHRLQKFYSTDGIHPFINKSMWWLKCAEKLIPSLLTSCFL